MKVLKIEEMLEVQDVDEESFGDLQNNQKIQSAEREKSEQKLDLSENKISEEEESEEEYRKRTGQEP